MVLTIVLAVLLVAYSSTVHLLPGFNALYLPINLLAAGGLALVARRNGITLQDLGLDPARARTGVRTGIVVAVLTAIALTVGILIPPLHPLFDDARLADIGPGLVLYRALIRIPLGTALFEEFAFRGVLFASWVRVANQRLAAIGTSIVFGLWHIRPALDMLTANGAGLGVSARSMAVAGAVAVTAVAGLFFCALRIRAESLWAPLIAHASINSLAVIAAALVTGLF